MTVFAIKGQDIKRINGSSAGVPTIKREFTQSAPHSKRCLFNLMVILFYADHEVLVLSSASGQYFN